MLSGLRGLVAPRSRRGGWKPDFELMASMIEYIEMVPEKVHHPRTATSSPPASATPEAPIIERLRPSTARAMRHRRLACGARGLPARANLAWRASGARSRPTSSTVAAYEHRAQSDSARREAPERAEDWSAHRRRRSSPTTTALAGTGGQVRGAVPPASSTPPGSGRSWAAAEHTLRRRWPQALRAPAALAAPGSPSRNPSSSSWLPFCAPAQR